MTQNKEDKDLLPVGEHQPSLNLQNMPTLAQVEQQYILQILSAARGDKALAAKVLGISLKTVYNKLATYQPE